MLTRHLGSVGDAGTDILFFQPGILVENLFRSRSAGKQV